MGRFRIGIDPKKFGGASILLPVLADAVADVTVEGAGGAGGPPQPGEELGFL